MSDEWPPEPDLRREPAEEAPGAPPPPDDAADIAPPSGEPVPTEPEPPPAEPAPTGDEGQIAVALLDEELIVPIRSSSGESPDSDLLDLTSLRHGMDADGRFLAAFTDMEAFAVLGPQGSDSVVLQGRDLFERAERADERVIVNPGSPDQVEVPAGVLPFLLAGIDLTTPGALRSRRRLGGLPDLEAPTAIPEPFGSEMQAALIELPAVERAWLLRVGTAWTVGVELDVDAPLSEFDAVRNRLHALATEHLGSRRNLVVTDLRAQVLRAHYASAAAPFYERMAPRGFFSRLLGRE